MSGFRKSGHIYEMISVRMCTFQSQCNITFVTGPEKRDQVGTKYTISQNSRYFEFCVQYLLSVSCKMLPTKLLMDSKSFVSTAVPDD